MIHFSVKKSSSYAPRSCLSFFQKIGYNGNATMLQCYNATVKAILFCSPDNFLHLPVHSNIDLYIRAFHGRNNIENVPAEEHISPPCCFMVSSHRNSFYRIVLRYLRQYKYPKQLTEQSFRTCEIFCCYLKRYRT